MAVTPDKKEETSAQPIGYTFGGHPIDVSEPPPEDATPETGFAGVSLVDDKPATGLVSLVSSDQPVSLTEEELQNKVGKFSFALGKDFSKQDIHQFLSTGNEDQLRRVAAKVKDIQDEKERTTTLSDILAQGVPADPKEQSVLYGNVKALGEYKPSNNPMTVVEEAYAKRFINEIPFIGPENETQRMILAQADKVVDAEHRKRVETEKDSVLTTMEMGERLKLSQEIMKDVLEKAEQTYAKESLWGKIVDFGKSAVPFYDYYNMTIDVPGMDRASVLPGTTIAQWVTKLYEQPPATQREWLQKMVDTAGAYNPALAVRIAEAAVSYSTTDEAMDNFFGVLDVMDAPGLGAGAIVGSVMAMGAARSAARRYAARNAFRTAIAASAPPHTNPGAFNAAMGNINGAAVHNAATMAPGASPSPQQMANATPTYMNPQAAPGASTGLAGAQTSRFANFVQQRAASLQRKFEAAIRVNRLPEEAYQIAMTAMKDEFENTVNQSVNSALQNATRLPGNVQRPVGPVTPLQLGVGGVPVRPEQTRENLARWEFQISKPNGQLFSNPLTTNEMRVWADLMGLKVGDYGTKQVGNGWIMTVSRPLDETKPYVRDHLITTKNTTSSTMTPIGWEVVGKHGGGRVSEFHSNNRIAYVMGQEKLREVIEPLAQDMLALKKDHVNALNRVMQEEAQTINPTTGLPGKFFDTRQDFDNAYRRLNGRSPTRKEVDAYISARVLNDLEFGLRNSSYYKELARLGMKKIELNTTKVDPNTGVKTFGKSRFEGKVIDELPLSASNPKDRAMVTVYHDGDPSPKIVPLHALLTEKSRAHIDELKAKGYSIIQTGNPVRKPGKEVFGEDESVNFIITKDYHARELDPADLIQYREGWHQIYPQKWFVKQPVVRKIDTVDQTTGRTFTHHLYEGETVHMGFHTEAEAKKYGPAMETARQIAYEGRAGNLDQFLADNLPYTRNEFRKLFEVGRNGEPPRFSKTEPFHVLGDGQTSMDAYKTVMEGRYSDLYDAIRSPWNLMNQVDKKFVGHRDEILHTVREGRGTQNNPVFNLARADRLDPLSAMSEGMANMIRNQHMIDLRLQFGESFIKEFRHILGGDERSMYNDLVNTILNPPYIPNIKNINPGDYSRAENARYAFMELLNLETPLQMSLENTRSKILNEIYERRGQEVSNAWATSNLMTTQHPLSFMRGIVFHWKVGMLNPLPALQNAVQMANVIAVSPVHGTGAFTFGMLAWLTRLNTHPAIVNAMGEVAEKATLGKYKKAWFAEGLEHLKKSGFFNVGGSHAMGDYLNDPKFVQKQFGIVLDASSFMFTESERALHTHAFMAAYLEHKVANPNKPFTSIDLNSVLGRANLMAGRMSRDEKARWQSGDMLSTFTQFWSYPARLMEMIWEKGHGRKDALTGAEKLRLLAMNSALYGLPIGGLGTAVGGLMNPYDSLKQKATDYGLNTDDGFWNGLFNGIVGVMSKEYLGVNASPALGPQGRDFTRTLDEDYGWFRFLTGATGGLAIDTMMSARPAMRGAHMIMNGDMHPKALAQDLLDIARNVKSVDIATKMYLAYVNHKAYTKLGQEVDGVETWPGLVSAILGQPVEKVDHIFWERKVLQNFTKIQQDVVKQAQRDYRLSLQAHGQGDTELEAHYAKRVHTLINSLPESKRAETMHEVYKATLKLKDTIDQRWQQYSPEATEDFKKAYGKYFTNTPGNSPTSK